MEIADIKNNIEKILDNNKAEEAKIIFFFIFFLNKIVLKDLVIIFYKQYNIYGK